MSSPFGRESLVELGSSITALQQSRLERIHARRIDSYDLVADRERLAEVDQDSAGTEWPEGPGASAETYVHPEPYAAVKGWYWTRCTDDLRVMQEVWCTEVTARPYAMRSAHPRPRQPGWSLLPLPPHDHLLAFTPDGEFLEQISLSRYLDTVVPEEPDATAPEGTEE